MKVGLAVRWISALALVCASKTGVAHATETSSFNATSMHIATCGASFRATGSLSSSCKDMLEAATSTHGQAHALLLSNALAQGDAKEARARFDVIRDALDESDRAKVEAEIAKIENRIDYGRWAKIGGAGVVLWFSLMAFFLVVGSAFSRRAESVSNEILEGRFRSMPIGLRNAYRKLIALSGAYFYISLPIVAAIVVASVAGIVFGFVSIGRIPIKLLVIVAVVALATLWSIARSTYAIFFTKSEDPGERLDLAEHPRLRELLADVASRVNTRNVDEVFVTPGTELAVYEHGGVFAAMRGTTKRCLILGVGLLEGMETKALASVLAHEFGHFRNEDTAGGHLALAVRRSMLEMVSTMVRTGSAANYNPAWWFLRGFSHVFARVSAGASRLQEVLADHAAVKTFGSEAFVQGFRHVIERSVRFDAHSNAVLNDVLSKNAALANLYAFVPSETAPETEVATAIEESLKREAGAYDSHPAPQKRLALATAMNVPEPKLPATFAEPAWNLFASRESLEAMMTSQIRDALELAIINAASQVEN